MCRYKNAYAKSNGALPSKDQWDEYSKDYMIGPPHAKRSRGRAKKNNYGK